MTDAGICRRTNTVPLPDPARHRQFESLTLRPLARWVVDVMSDAVRIVNFCHKAQGEDRRTQLVTPLVEAT